MRTYKEFYQGFGLDQFPFETFTTELESEKAQELFVPQGNYGPIVEAFNSKRSILLRGERGSGKTAILFDFIRLLPKKSLYSKVEDYSDLNIPLNSLEVYRILIISIVTDLFSKLAKSPFRLHRLSKDKRILLSYLIHTFLPSYSVSQLQERIVKVQVPVLKRTLIWLYNLGRGPLNLSGTVAKNIAVEYVLKHFSSIPILTSESQVTQFFPELKLNVDMDFFDKDVSFSLLRKVGEIVSDLGYRKPVVFFDKFDEDSRFENDAEGISEFILPVFTDGKLLSMEEIQLVFFTWSTPFRFVEDRVRTQKYYCPILEWSIHDLKKALNRRLSVFSGGKIEDYNILFSTEVSEERKEEIFHLSNSNPRDLWHIMKTIFEEQYKENPESSKINDSAIEKGFMRFVGGFNYYEYYPRKSNSKASSMDIYSYAAHLIKLENHEFTKNQLNEKAGTGSSTHNYVVGMEKIGLVERLRQDKGVVIYRIKDPKIIFAMRNNLEIRSM